ncbi:glycoside hydrolase family 76 protein [Paenibacillus solisilvae]|uniref:Glycoside hydrolase family 76 protein n=1 Tax=Paenibacillus solisilvae TaxID=2486751 RepID=A0ABW0W8Z2_9BACL
MMKQAELSLWEKRADEAQEALDRLFWNDSIRMYNIETPCQNGECNTIFHYWWMAHAVDVLVDGYIRTQDVRYIKRLETFHEGIIARNGGALPNELYDDMEWMALAFLRAYQVTGNESYKRSVLILWEDIKTGWNDHMGGGIAWQKPQLDYKNTPANGPAAILAVRLYQVFGNETDLKWALKIYHWLKEYLVDPETGFVWDGMNRNGDGRIDKEWKFTYCQGVYIGAAVELYRIIKDQAYLDDAVKTYTAAKAELADPASSVLPDEGNGDGGLFKGILIRYTAELVKEASTAADAAAFIAANATLLWEQGKSANETLFGTDWSEASEGVVSLSAQLSGIKLLEQAAELSRLGLVK